MAPTLQNLVLGSSISFSFILAGNAITQSFMTVPALLVDFPSEGSQSYSTRATLLGPLGYAFTSYSAYNSATTKADWRLFAVAAFTHLVTIVHSTSSAWAEALLRKWGKWNVVRVITPSMVGVIALWQFMQ
ncbi:hypothetical protein BDZ45DRAFT_715978 [Acephala macrosclerotiorum]|nr:hypothetical protein BDZ45DRAFT_715978 [Acephala macrosclerotiorum]